MQVCISLQTKNHASTPPLKFFTGRMPFLPPSQQRQSTYRYIPANMQTSFSLDAPIVFLTRDAMLARYMLWFCVCVGHKWVSTKMARCTITITVPHHSPRDSSFLMPKISAKLNRGQPLRGRQIQVGGLKSATLDK